MKFRGRSTFIYLLLALGMVCYLTFIDKKIPGTHESDVAAQQLFSYDQDAVTGLEITNVHGTFIFEKKGDHWEITSPVSTLADNGIVGEINSSLALLQPQRTIHLDGSAQQNENNLKEWGLSPATDRAVIHLKDRSLQLLIGRKIAINDSVYARTSEHRDAPVQVIPSAIKNAIEKDLPDFRSRSIFDFEPERVTSVATSVAQTATTPAQECEIDFKDSKWKLAKPLVARALTSDVQLIIQKILALRINDFITDEPGNSAKYGLTSPVTTLSVTLGADDEGVLQIGSPVPGKPDQVYAQRVKSNSIFTLTQSAIADIVKSLPATRNKQILPFEPGAATALSFNVAGKKPAKADLRRDAKSVWQVVGESAGSADVGKLTDVLTRLNQLQTTPTIIDSAPDLKAYGLDKPTGTISITLPDSKTPLTLSIGKDDKGLLYVRNSIEPFIYTVPDTSFDYLGDNLFYREKRAINLIAAKVRSIKITAQGKPSLVLDRSPGGTWTAENAKDRQIDATKADGQASVLCDLQAQVWLGAPQPSYGLDKPVLIFAIQSDQPTITTLRIGAALPDGNRAAQVEGSPNAFAMSEGDFDILNSSTLQLIPSELNGTNAAPATNAAPVTNAPTATNAAPAKPAKSAEPVKKKKKKNG